MAKILILHAKGEKPTALHSGLLKQEGFTAQYVSDRKEVLKILSKEDISFFILSSKDCSMLLDIKQQIPFQRILINITSEDYEKHKDCMNNDLYEIVKWPYTTQELIVILRRYERRFKTIVKEHISFHMLGLYENVQDMENRVNLFEHLQYSFGFISTYLKADTGSVMLLDDSRKELRIIAAQGIDDDTVKNSIICNGEAISGWVTANRKSIILDGNNFNEIKFSKITPRDNISSSMIVLLEDVHGPIGVVTMNSLSGRKFLDKDLELFSFYALRLSKFIRKVQHMQSFGVEYEKLEEQNKEMEAFVYSAFHDLKTPLFTLECFLDNLKEYMCDKLDDKSAMYVSGISHGAHRLENMIKDAFEYFKFDKMQYKKEPIHIEELVDIALDQLQLLTASLHTEVKITKKGKDWPVVSGDQYRLLRVWVNLIENAIKYRHPKRKAVIIVGYEDNGGDMITFFVKDNGIGMETRFFDFIFKVFGRLKDKEKVEGTGVGLSIVKKMILRHSGNIWVESTKGKGSTFYFTLPRYKDDTRCK